MKTLLKISAIGLVAISLASCGTQENIAGHNDDGIYASRDNNIASANTPAPAAASQSQAPAAMNQDTSKNNYYSNDYSSTVGKYDQDWTGNDNSGDYYDNNYGYDYDPYAFGSSLYFGDPWWGFGYGYPYYGWGLGLGFGWGYPYCGLGFGWDYGYGWGWGYGYPGYWGGGYGYGYGNRYRNAVIGSPRSIRTQSSFSTFVGSRAGNTGSFINNSNMRANGTTRAGNSMSPASPARYSYARTAGNNFSNVISKSPGAFANSNARTYNSYSRAATGNRYSRPANNSYSNRSYSRNNSYTRYNSYNRSNYSNSQRVYSRPNNYSQRNYGGAAYGNRSYSSPGYNMSRGGYSGSRYSSGSFGGSHFSGGFGSHSSGFSGGGGGGAHFSGGGGGRR